MTLFSIITPTVQRDSLIQCCESVNNQRCTSWQHVVIIDCAERNEELIAKIEHPQRIILQCPKPHRNTGNTCRHDAWSHALGEWTFHLDDDNLMMSPTTLGKIAKDLTDAGDAMWALYPIFRHGSIFYFNPPQPCYFDTGNAVVRREVARWPDIDGYASDAVWLEELLKHPYKAFPDALPIMEMPTTRFGAGGGINGQ